MTVTDRAKHRLGIAISRVGDVAGRPLRADLLPRLDALSSRLAELERAHESSMGRLEHLIREQERKARRDLQHALDLEATRSTAAFIQGAMPAAKAIGDMRNTLRHGLALAPRLGLALEFGVASGETLRIIAEARRHHDVFGFDSFEGLPEDWRTGFPRGRFAVECLPEVHGATLVPGLFQETLPSWLESHQGPIAFVHLDADLYSSTKYVLDTIEARLMPDAVLVFDEFFNYPSWPDHEYRAWAEFVDRTRIEFSYEAYTSSHEQVVVKLRGSSR